MQSPVSNIPYIKVKNLQAKFDAVVISNSFITLIGEVNEAYFLHQLHYWSYSQYGVVLDGIRWIYKPLREWLTEVFPFMTEWKLRKAIASLLDKGLIERKKLYVKHHEIKHDNPYWNPKNQTYYYSVNYDNLQERINEAERGVKAESTENVCIEDSTKLSSEVFQDTKFCELSQNKTDITSIENKPSKSHPHLPCEWNKKEKNSQEVNPSNRQVIQTEQINSFNSQVIEPEMNTERVEQEVNQNNSTNQYSVQELVQVEAKKPKLKKSKETQPKRKSKAPWKNQEQFKAFYSVLIQAIPIVANARSPQGLAQTIIRQLRSGNPHTYWDDFAAGQPIGFSTKPEWEIEPGVPYPMFIEYLTEKLKAGNNTKTDEQTRNEVFSILDKPRQAKAFWGQFKRSVVNVSEQVERDRALGVSSPNTPVWTRERIEPSIEEAAEAGQKITAVNDETKAVLESTKNPQLESKDNTPVSQSPSLPNSPITTSPNESEQASPPPDPWSEEDSKVYSSEGQSLSSMREMLAERGVKGFCKLMPKVSRAEAKAESEAIQRQQMNRKNHISQMSLAEINELVRDPIFRAQLTPQLLGSDYELITDELGQIIRIELSELQKREKRRFEGESP